MSDGIDVVLDADRTWRVGGGKDGRVHTRYYHCYRGEFGYDCAVSVAMAESAKGLKSWHTELRCEEVARSTAEAAFREHADKWIRAAGPAPSSPPEPHA